MAIAQWNDDLKTGEEEVDKEHWGLFALINDLNGKWADGASVASMNSTFEALTSYVDVHFEHEERLMDSTGYPELSMHKNAHAILKQLVLNFKEEFNQSPETFNYNALMEFLSNWLNSHILELDMKFSVYHRQLKKNDKK